MTFTPDSLQSALTDGWLSMPTAAPHPAAAALLVLAFAAHNAEELVFYRRMAANAFWPSVFTRTAFILAILLLTLAVAALAATSVLYGRHYTALFFVASCMLALNAFSHVAATLYKRAYAPGVATAALLILPASATVLAGLISANQLTVQDIGLLVLLAAFAYLPILWGVIAISIGATRLVAAIAQRRVFPCRRA